MLHEEIIPLICDALDKYPLSEPQDIVKLLFQREFGPAHAIADHAYAAKRLMDEYASCAREEGVLCEYIGNGYARVSLKRLDHNSVTPERVLEAFIKSAVPAGDRAAFSRELRELAADPFTASLMPALPAFIEEYAAAGCPVLSHSEAYRAAYSPAYRVVKAELLFIK